MAGFVWILLKYKLKHIVVVSGEGDRSPICQLTSKGKCDRETNNKMNMN
ncbi:MAG: hypothetical protein JGK17_00375 [Microcoleus sp. PH2017_10_PVI_O_A]|nr:MULTISPECIES: hypothetical protein [unclassified Microcoleus]MCC3404075.1 hypothetical protein [Microcoleus sp. PH2017_10_PVI_O_A]MCC3458158.1 hypothetical protein [Microcoleus sp. PH2017_11_PCY_U_A]MCC3476580.1 hypothetical protein [Microcoleus sp. PH2017_12_PCY_D_A]MCC3557594.1 hypothetical protein [Microcoleus sp. PH2017_27_LUM_O_A]